MKRIIYRHANFLGGTRVTRVQFGVAPNCGRVGDVLFQGRAAGGCPSPFGFGRDARNNRPEACSTRGN